MVSTGVLATLAEFTTERFAAAASTRRCRSSHLHLVENMRSDQGSFPLHFTGKNYLAVTMATNGSVMRGLLVLSVAITLCHGFINVQSCYARNCDPLPPNCSYAPDASGCPTCDLVCNAPGCEPLNCEKKCYNGYIQDEKGCSTCECKPGCRERQCPWFVFCPYGYVEDKVGCPTCFCKPKPLACHVFLVCPQGACPNDCSCRPYCYDRGNNNENGFGKPIALQQLWASLNNHKQ